MKLIIQIPCYNEAETLEVALNDLPKQIDGMGGTVSSNNKIVIVWKSEEPGGGSQKLGCPLCGEF